MDRPSDGYLLNAHIRSSHPTPSGLMVDLLALLEADMRMASEGRSVLIEQWVQWARKDRAHADALIRVLFLTLAVRGTTIDDVATLRVSFRDTLKNRRRPTRSPRESGPRESRQLW